MPKTPESGGIPLPYSWPPFNRADWDNRAYALLASLSRMGHEDEDYASVPAAINLSKKALAKAASQREESSLGLAKIKNKEKKAVGGDGVEGDVTKQEEGTSAGTTTEKSTVEEGDNNNGDNADNKESDVKKEDEEEDDPNQLKVKPTKVLKTFEQRRKYIVKVMDLHRHTVGGGRSGRRGRAESTAFFRYVLQILDEQYEEALEAGSQDDDDDGKYVKGEENNDDDSSSSEEETEEDNVMEGGEVEGEDLDEGSDVGDSEAEPSQPKTTPRRRGRPPKNQSSTQSSKKSKSPRAATKVVINEQEFFDQHNDLCEVCNQPGELLCCATCNLVFHVACARPRLTKEPPDDWNCSYCWAAGVRGGKKDGKERRKAAQACREMEKMRKTLREERERNGGNVKDESLDDEEEEEMSEEESEEEEEEEGDDEVDKKPAPKKRGPRQYSSGPRPSLEEAAAAGCRKCVRELDTGEKTRKVHDDWCPRKFQGPGRPSASPGSATKKRKKEEEDEAEESEEEDEIEESEVEESASEEEETISELKESRSTSPKNVRKDGKISLEVAAKACNKCKLELETGEKTRKSHADNCPRKFRGKSTSPVPPPVASSEADGTKMHAADDAVELPKDTVSNDDEDAAAAAPSKKSGRKGGRPPAKKKRGPNPKNLVPLEEAAKFCVKCERELETGEKTRKEHSEDCPRKWRSAGRPPAGTPSPASAVAAAERQAKKSPPLAQPKSPVRSSSRKRGKRNRDQMEDTAEDEPAIATTATAEEEAIAGLGDLASMAMKQEEEGNKSDGGNDETADKMDTEEEDAGGGEAKSLRGGGETDGGVTFTVDDGAVETEQVPSSMAFVHGEIDYVDDEAQPLRGGGRTKKAPVKTEENDVNVTVNDEAVVAPEGTPTNSGASTPTKRELDYLTVPTPLKLGDEHDLTYANNGRVQRSRKKPAVFDPQDVPAREWGLKSGDDNSPDKVEPEELRGGMVKPSKEVTAAKLAAEAPVPTAPRRGRPPKNASLTAEAPASAPTAPRRGRPPTKQTKGGKKKNAARAPIKKETNTTVGGVGLLNRKPGVLFDCPVCLDLPKIKFCCYCACRICFNKFGKEQTMLCDTCDQEYHTFCLGLEKIPDGGFECPACIADAEKKRKAGERKKEREAKKKLEEEKRAIEEEKKAIIKAQRKAAYAARKQEEEERKRIQLEKRKIAYEKRKSKEAEMKSLGLPIRGTKSLSPQALGIKRGPGRPSKAEMVARLQAQQALVQKQQEEAAASGKRGRGRPRKDGSAPVPRIKPSKNEIALENMYLDTTDLSAERSRSGRKISRTTFHDDLEGGGLMKKARTDEHGGIPSKSSSGKGSMYVSERRSAVAAKNAISGRGRSQEPRKDSRRKPGARECMQISRKFDAGVIEQKHFDMLMDYSQRGKVDHLIRLRERMDEHSRYLEAQLAGLEALVKEKGEHIDMRVPPAKVD